MSRRPDPEPQQISAKDLLKLKKQLHVPDDVWNLCQEFAGRGRETETNAQRYFETVSRHMVMSAGRVQETNALAFNREVAKVLRAFATRRDGHNEYNGHWAPYLNDALKLWQQDYTHVWDDYSHNRL